jgi:hypothetical protein
MPYNHIKQTKGSADLDGIAPLRMPFDEEDKKCQTFEHLPLFLSKAGQDLVPCLTGDRFGS